MTDSKEAVLMGLRSMLAAVEAGADIANATVSRDLKGVYQVEVLLSRGAQLKPFTFNGIQAPTPRAHISARDSLERYGTGHPSEQPCIMCGRPTYDIIDRWQTADRKPLCSKACFDRVLSAPAGAYDDGRKGDPT